MIDGRRRRRAGDAPAPGWFRRLATRLALGTRLARRGVRADVVTAVGVLLAGATGVLFGTGHRIAGVATLIVGGLMDALDGAVAKAAGSSSVRGAFVDSVADRVSDALIFGGVAWYLLTGAHPREALIPVSILAVGALISYERAKAESLGLSAKGGLMERAERLILLGVAMLWSVLVVPLLSLLLALTVCTAIGRFSRIWQLAGGNDARQPRREFVAAGVESRWRAWRETGQLTRAPRPRRERQALAARVRRVVGASGPHASASGRRLRAMRAFQQRIERDR